MTASDLMRWAGLAALASAALAVVGDLLRLFVDVESAQTATTAPYALVFLLYLLSAALILLGLIGIYASQSEQTGVLGLISFVVAFFGTVLLAGAVWFELFITPSLAAEAPGLVEAELGLTGFILVFLFGALGWILFGIATLRAQVYPRWAALLLIVGGVFAYFPIPLSGIVFSVAIAWLGFILYTERGTPSEGPSRVS